MNLTGRIDASVIDVLQTLTSGYDRWAIWVHWANIKICEKPVDIAKLAKALYG